MFQTVCICINKNKRYADTQCRAISSVPTEQDKITDSEQGEYAKQSKHDT